MVMGFPDIIKYESCDVICMAPKIRFKQQKYLGKRIGMKYIKNIRIIEK